MTDSISTLLNQIDALNQEVKTSYLKCTDRLAYPNQGFGSDNNGVTTKIINDHQWYQQFFSKCQTLKRSIRNLPIPEKYLVTRELLLIHPGLHEMWYFNGHFNYLSGNGSAKYSALCHRWGFNSYLTSLNRGTLDKRGRRYGLARIALIFTSLMENQYCSHLDISLLDVEPVNEKKLKKNIECLNKMSFSNPGDILAVLPLVFEITRTLLAQTHDYALKNDQIIDKVADVNWAMCAINEGPIFFKKTDTPRLDIIKSIQSFDQDAIRKTLRNHYDIIVDEFTIPYDSIEMNSHNNEFGNTSPI